MWFKNLRFYTVDTTELENVLKNPEELERTIKAVSFRPCEANEASRVGFAPIYGNDGPYTFSSGSNYFFKLTEEQKLLPSSVVKTEVESLVKDKELELKRMLNKQERETIKAAVANKLLARAFATRRDLLIFVNTQKKIVAISATSAKRAEAAIAMLREAFSTFPAKLLTPRCLPDARLTSWLSDAKIPEKFKLGSETTLKSKDEDGGIIRASKEDLTSDEIAVHLAAGKNVTELGLSFDDSVDFALTSELAIKRIKLSDIYLENNLQSGSEDEQADAQALLLLQGELLSQLIDYILEIFDCDRS
ncbi:MAG: recombination-associated protein RdgC [Succinivibrio sp.]